MFTQSVLDNKYGVHSFVKICRNRVAQVEDSLDYKRTLLIKLYELVSSIFSDILRTNVYRNRSYDSTTSNVVEA